MAIDKEQALVGERLREVEEKINEQETNILRAKLVIQNLRTGMKRHSIKPSEAATQLHQLKIVLGL